MVGRIPDAEPVAVEVGVCARVCVCARAHLCSCLCRQHPQQRSLSSRLRCLGEAASGVVRRGQDLALKVKKVATVLSLRNFPPPFGHQWGWCRPCCSFSELETLCLQGVFGGYPTWTNHFLFVEIAERTQER